MQHTCSPGGAGRLGRCCAKGCQVYCTHRPRKVETRGKVRLPKAVPQSLFVPRAAQHIPGEPHAQMHAGDGGPAKAGSDYHTRGACHQPAPAACCKVLSRQPPQHTGTHECLCCAPPQGAAQRAHPGGRHAAWPCAAPPPSHHGCMHHARTMCFPKLACSTQPNPWGSRALLHCGCRHTHTEKENQVPSALAAFASLRAVLARGGTQWQEQDFLGGPAELEAGPCPSSTNTWTWVYTACDQGGARCHPPAARSAPADCSPATAPPTHTHLQHHQGRARHAPVLPLPAATTLQHQLYVAGCCHPAVTQSHVPTLAV